MLMQQNRRPGRCPRGCGGIIAQRDDGGFVELYCMRCGWTDSGLGSAEPFRKKEGPLAFAHEGPTLPDGPSDGRYLPYRRRERKRWLEDVEALPPPPLP